MKRYRLTLDDRQFDVRVLDDPRQEQVRVEVDGEVFLVGVEPLSVVAEVGVGESPPVVVPSPAAPTSAPDSAVVAAAGTDRTIVAPLPGVIKSIAVRSGQEVAPDDELLVIEAMKMDNIIRAVRAGTVGTIYVTEGRQVAYGEPLLEMTNDQ
jgi:biotin carboxyl carrier protein